MQNEKFVEEQFHDQIEIITVDDTNWMRELEITSEDFPNGYKFYNSSRETIKLPLGPEVTYDFTDSGQVYEKEDPNRNYVTNVLEEFYTASAYNQEFTLEEQRIPYLIGIRDGKVYEIIEIFLFTQ